MLLLAAYIALSACAGSQKAQPVWPKEQRAQAHIDLGRSYLKRGELEFARSSFDKALAAYPDSSAAYHGLGLVEAKSLHMTEARRYLKRAVRLDDNNIGARSDYAVVLCDTGSVNQGIHLLEQTQSNLARETVGMNLALGQCYQANQMLKEAQQAYQSVLLINPSIRQALLSMAYIKFGDHNYLSSRAFLQRYFSTNTVSSEALLLAAKVERNLSNIDGQNDYTRQLWSRYPKSKQASEARELFIQ